MRYVSKINVHAPGITELLRSGAMRLQKGQWIECGTGSRKYGHYPSRFSHVSPGGIIVAYHGPDAARKFLAVCAGEKTAQAFLDACRAKREAEREAAEAAEFLFLLRTLRAQVIPTTTEKEG